MTIYNKVVIISKEVALKKLQRMSLEIIEQHYSHIANIVFIGIDVKGTYIAEIVLQYLKQYSLPALPIIITMQIDKKVVGNCTRFSKEIDFKNKRVIIMDDVANSGYTLFLALQPLFQYKICQIQILVLIDRMHKMFPIKSDFIGTVVSTTLQDHIEVSFEQKQIKDIYLTTKKGHN